MGEHGDSWMRRAALAVLAVVLVVGAGCSGGSSGRSADSSTRSDQASTDAGSRSSDSAASDSAADSFATDTGSVSTDDTVGSVKLGQAQRISAGFRPSDVVDDGNGGFVALGTEAGGGAAYTSAEPGAAWKATGRGSDINATGLEPSQASLAHDGTIVTVGRKQVGKVPATAAFLVRRGGSEQWQGASSDLDGAPSPLTTEMVDVTYDGDGFIAVGSRHTGADTLGNIDPTTAVPLVETTGNGRKWTASAVPLPSGAAGGILSGITVTPNGTALPGLVAVGEAFYPVPDPSIGFRRTATVWHSDDGGFAWRVVSDPGDFQGDSELSSLKVVAATSTDIVVAGVSAPGGAQPDANGVIQEVAAYWRLGPSDTSWSRMETNAQPGQSSSVEFLEPEGARLLSAELTQPTGTSRNVGKIDAYSTDGSRFTDVTLATGAQRLLGLTGENGYIVVVGVDDRGGGAAWITKGDT